MLGSGEAIVCQVDTVQPNVQLIALWRMEMNTWTISVFYDERRKNVMRKQIGDTSHRLAERGEGCVGERRERELSEGCELGKEHVPRPGTSENLAPLAN